MMRKFSLRDAPTTVDKSDSVIVFVSERSILADFREYSLRLPAGASIAYCNEDQPRFRREDGNQVSILQISRGKREPVKRECGIGPRDCLLLPMIYGPESPVATHVCNVSRLVRLDGRHSDQLLRETRSAIRQILLAQRAARQFIARCGGRSAEQRLDQYLRLLRARAVLAWGVGSEYGISKVAAIAHISPSYFKSLFQRVFDCSPHQYRIVQRMHYARWLLAHTDQSITQIVSTLGIGSPAEFMRMFRRRFGMSATAMRTKRSAN